MSAGQLSLIGSFYEHSWTIENFTSYCEKEDSTVEITSPVLLLSSDIGFYLTLSIHNDSIDHNEKEDIELRLIMKKKDSSPVRAEFDFCVLNTENDKVYCQNEPLFYTFTSSTQGFGRKYFLKKSIVTDPVHKLLQDDKLTILTRINILSEDTNEVPVFYKKCSESESLVHNQEFTDVTLRIGGEELKVHKAILAYKSPVFKAMFCHNTREANENSVKIIDFSFDVIKDMVQFMYTGHIENFENHAADLLAVADKYCIEDLKIICCRFYHKRLNIENAVETLILSTKHNLGYFSSFLKTFIADNLDKIMETKGFEDAKETHSNLLLELVCFSYKNKK